MLVLSAISLAYGEHRIPCLCLSWVELNAITKEASLHNRPTMPRKAQSLELYVVTLSQTLTHFASPVPVTC